MDGSGGGGFDACELLNIFMQEGRMARLIQMLRQSQASSCNDVECLSPDDLILPSDRSTTPAAGSGDDFGLWALLFFWVLMAAVLFVNRPRRSGVGDQKRDLNNEQGGRGHRDDEGPSIF